MEVRTTGTRRPDVELAPSANDSATANGPAKPDALVTEDLKFWYGSMLALSASRSTSHSMR